MTVSKWAINQALLYFEISWDEKNGFDVYKKKYAYPTVPLPDTTDSGVTIGLGFDCGQNTKEAIERLFFKHLTREKLALLVNSARLKKQEANLYCKKFLRNIYIPVEAAKDVFYNYSLPLFAKKTEAIYPEINQLNTITQACILSMVYNRGASLQGDRRIEMKEMQAAIKNKDYKKISTLFLSMSNRLWPNIDGLKKRYRKKAMLVDTSFDTAKLLTPDDLLNC